MSRPGGRVAISSPVEVSGTALSRDEKGWARQVFTVMRDASKDESRYRQIVENLHEGIWIVHTYNSTRFVNQRMADMLGYNIDELIGKSLFDFLDSSNQQLCKEKLGSHRIEILVGLSVIVWAAQILPVTSIGIAQHFLSRG